MASRVSVVKHQLDPGRAFKTLRALYRSSFDTIAGVRAEGEVAVLRDAQDFRGSVQEAQVPRLRFTLVGEVRTGWYRR